MTFEIDVNGRPWIVVVDPIDANASGGRFQIAAHERRADADALDAPSTCIVDARRTDLGLSIVYAEDQRVVDAAVTMKPGGEALVQLPHVDVPTVVDGRRFRRGAGGAGGSGEQRVVAPMPGRVLRVLVRPGDEVSACQGLVVVEAMKMENELGALRAGRVREVVVGEGVSVEAGRLLIVIE
jgi:biotin carboxyl carrier protein